MIGHNAFEPLWTAMEAATQARIDEAVERERERGFKQTFLVSAGWLFLLGLVVAALKS